MGVPGKRNPLPRFAWIVCLAMVWQAVDPAKSYALCDWLCSWLRPRGTAVTTYTPPFSPRPQVAAAMPAATVCSYVPQTAYQAVYRPVPVTAYQPVTTWDPCSGCATRAYRPVVAWGYQTQLVPTTTYRMVCTTPTTTYAPPAVSYGTIGTPVWSGTVTTPACGACAPSTGVPSLSPVPSPLSTPLSPGAPMTMPGPLPSASAGASTPAAGGQAPASGAAGTGGSAAGPGATAAPGSTAPATPSGTTPTYAPPPGSTTPPSGPISPSAPGRSGSLFDSPGFRLRVSPGPTMPSSTPAAPASRIPGRTALLPVVAASFTQETFQSSATPVARPQVSEQPLDVGGWQPLR